MELNTLVYYIYFGQLVTGNTGKDVVVQMSTREVTADSPHVRPNLHPVQGEPVRPVVEGGQGEGSLAKLVTSTFQQSVALNNLYQEIEMRI